jgi:signal transduction histidine kinase
VRQRILLLTVGMTTLVVLAFAIPLIPLIRSVIEQRNERAAIDEAQTIGLYLRDNSPDDADLKSYLADLNGRSARRAQVQQSDGTLIGATLPASAINAQQPDATGSYQNGNPTGGNPTGGNPAGGAGGFPTREASLVALPDGAMLARQLAPGPGGFGSDDSVIVRVYLSPSAHTAGMTGWLLLLGGVSVGLLVLGAAAAELLTRRIVRPLLRTATVAHELSQGDLFARAPTTGPREVAEVASALNRLAGRIDELISEERETVADLSHRLRTPLTALRLEAESLPAADAERIGDRVGVLERTLTNVIHAARRPQREGIAPSVDATELVGERLDFWQPLADEQDRDVQRELPAGPLVVRSSPEDLAAALDALLENVFAHTPDGAAMSVRLRPDAGGAVLEVADSGPGFEPAAAARGRSDRGSSGLGLDIARRAAEASGGAMTISASPAGGGLVTLRLGAPHS